LRSSFVAGFDGRDLWRFCDCFGVFLFFCFFVVLIASGGYMFVLVFLVVVVVLFLTCVL